jgi:predicted aldo/keto reductase-like oxidoreductase
MGPVGGGRLGQPTEVIQGLLKSKRVSTAELAMRFVYANKNIDMALSGMSSLDMVKENIAISIRTDFLSDEELDHINKAMEENKNLEKLYCTGCDYCKPCPQGIDIAYIFGLMNQHRVYEITDHAKAGYRDLINGWAWLKSPPASACTACGECEKKCPQKLPIIKQLAETHGALT